MKEKLENNRVKLLQKIFKVMKAIPELVKTGQMQEGESKSYAYHEADSIRERFRAELIKNKLLCLPTELDGYHWGNPTSTGGTFNYSAQKITFTFFDVETAESLSCQAEGWGGDSLDKAAPKAAIQALKYFLTNGFFVKGTELDGDSPEEQIAGREANKQHQWFEGPVEGMYFDTEHPWVMIEGNRLFIKQKKILSQAKKLWKDVPSPEATGPDHPEWLNLRIRTFMAPLNGDSKNPHPIIDKIEVIEAKNGQNDSVSAEIPQAEAEAR